MSFSFLKKPEKREVVLILDIGSASVSGSFVEFLPKENPTVLTMSTEPIKFIKELRGDRFKKEMFKSLGIVLQNLTKESSLYLGGQGGRVFKVYCSLASPWFVSQTKTIKINRDKEFDIDEDFIAELLNKEEESFEESDLSKYGSDKRLDSETIERKLIDTKLNGYRTLNPVGKRATSAEFNLFMSMSQKSILDSIEDTILKHFHVREIHFNSFTLISFLAVRDMYDRVPNFILLDITGEVTDVSLIKSGSIAKTTSFPYGKNSLIRELASGEKTSGEEALSLMRLMFSGHLGQTKTKKVKTILDNAGSKWVKEFQKALLDLSGGAVLPTTVFFTSDEDIAPFFGEIIRSEAFIQKSLTQSSFVVSFLNPFSLDSYVSFRRKEERDTFIAVSAIFFNRIFELRE
jgi:cell division ATPase FtsA